MDCLFYETKNYILQFCEMKKKQSIAHVFSFRNREICFIEAVRKVDPTEYTDDIYVEISKICNVESVYIDLSSIYGDDNNSWLMKWDFITDMNGNLLDERFHVMKDLKNIEKDEYIVLKEYINRKQNNLTFC